MNLIPKSVTRALSKQVLSAKRNSPTILFVGGVTAGIASTVFACRATLRVEEVMNEHKKHSIDIKTVQHVNYTEQDQRHDITLLYVQTAMKFAKLYGPSIVLGVASVTMLTKSHSILTKRNAGLAAAYTALSEGFSDYRKRVVDELGEDKDREFRFGSKEITEITEDKNGPKKRKRQTVDNGGGSIYSKLFGNDNVNWDPHPEYNILFLRQVQNSLNDQLAAKGYLLLNDAYEQLGFKKTTAGSQVGWLWDRKYGGDGHVDFGIFADESVQNMHKFLIGEEGEIWLDFNVDGPVWRKIDDVS